MTSAGNHVFLMIFWFFRISTKWMERACTHATEGWAKHETPNFESCMLIVRHFPSICLPFPIGAAECEVWVCLFCWFVLLQKSTEVNCFDLHNFRHIVTTQQFRNETSRWDGEKGQKAINENYMYKRNQCLFSSSSSVWFNSHSPTLLLFCVWSCPIVL